jgi:ATP-dependent DNA helicase DinG
MSIPASNLIDLSAKLQARGIELAPPVQSPTLSPVETILRETLPKNIQGYEVREPQISMSTMIESALANNEHVLAEAGTGTGKSVAYLLPLHLHLKQNGGRAVVSTGTIALQEQLIQKDIPLLEATLHKNFRARLAKGKANYLCKLRLATELNQLAGMFLDSEANQLLQIEEWAANSQTGDKAELLTEQNEIWSKVCADDNCTGRRCVYYAECFVTRAKQLLSDAQIIITNHNLFCLDLAVKDKSDGNAYILPDYEIVCVDEAHKIEEIARAALSKQCSIFRLPLLLKQVQKIPGADWNLIEGAKLQNDHFFNMAATLDKSDKFRFRPNNALIEQGNKLLQIVEGIAKTESDGMSDHDASVLGNVGKLFWDLVYILSADQGRNVYWVEKTRSARGGQKVTLNGTPIDVAPLLRDMLFENDEINSVIMTSATLSTGGKFDYLKKSVGCSLSRELIVESPFDYSQQCLLYLPSNLPEPNSPNFHQGITTIIHDILQATNGRALVLFTSYKGMNEVYSSLQDRLPWRVLKQGDMPKRALLDAFRDDVHSVLMATATFWEGVDIIGESLSCVIIDRLPFSVPDDPISQAKADALKRNGGNVFAHLNMPEAILKLKQGFGRLIRTGTDRGVVAILDSRITGKGYGKVFLRSLPGARVVRELADVEWFMGEVE